MELKLHIYICIYMNLYSSYTVWAIIIKTVKILPLEWKIVYVYRWTSEWKGGFSLLDILGYVDDEQVKVWNYY